MDGTAPGRTGTPQSPPSGWGLAPQLLHTAFPFHLVLDRDLRILQAGRSAQTLHPQLQIGSALVDTFDLISPKVSATFDAFRARRRSLFLLRGPKDVTLRGQVLHDEDADVLIFVGSPWVTEVSALRHMGLTLNDFAASDAVIDYLLLVQQQANSLAQAHELATALEENEGRTRRILETANDAFVEMSADGVVTAWNPRAEEMFGWTATEAIGRPLRHMVIPPHVHEVHLERIATLVAGRREPLRKLEFQALRKDGHAIPVEVALWATWHQGTPSVNFSARDVSERKEAERHAAQQAAALEHQALHDPLTGLGNRTLLRDRLEHALATRGRDVSVLLLDLDDFKAVNDVSGHAAGDQMLVEVSRRLRSCIRPGDTVTRLGGDEFALVVEGDHADDLAQRVLATLATPLAVAGRQVIPMASIGIAGGAEGVGMEEVLLQADVAMYAAKAGGKGRVEHFTPEMTEAIRKRADLHDALRRAVHRGEIVVHFQPILDVRAGEVTRVEALARWQRADRLVLPSGFLCLAEETGLINDIGHEVLRQTCERLGGWLAADERRTVAVNVSAVQLSQSDLAARVLATLADHDVRPDQLILEVTESLFLDTTAELVRRLTLLRDHGVAVSIDDFGTGYSSLGRLHALPIDSIKIDQSFVKLISTGAEELPIITSMVLMAHALGLDVTAEGVETAQQAQCLIVLGCDYLQGYHFARPHPAPAALTSVAQQAQRAYEQVSPVLRATR